MNSPRQRRSLPSLLGLQAFEATARLGTVSLAAQELNLTQSAVSRQLIGLEERLGVNLFRRTRKRLVLSEAGAAYLHDVRGGLARLGDATESLLATRGRSGTLKLATLPTFGAKWLVPRLGRFRDQFPGITIELLTRLAPFDFSIEEIDGAIHFGGPDWPGSVAEFLLKEKMAAIATPALAARCTSPAAVLEAPLLQITSRAFAWQDWLEAAGLPDARHVPSLQVETFAMGIEAVLAGLCVGILPRFLVENELLNGRLVAIGDFVESRSAYYFVYPDRKRDYYPLRQFADWIVREIQLP
jgi:LysR family transcriptional regulator, glycine cleavage system transcriptional activator